MTSPDLTVYDYDSAEAWELQPGESTRAYECFAVYRDLGPNRTRVAAAEQLKVSTASLKDWFSRNAWEDRVRAYDLERDRANRVRLESERLAMRLRHAGTAVFLQKKVAERLALMDPMEMTPKDAVYALDLASKLERISRGEDATKIEITGKDGGPIELAEALTTDDRIALMAQVQAELAKRLDKPTTQAEIEGVFDAEIVDGEAD